MGFETSRREFIKAGVAAAAAMTVDADAFGVTKAIGIDAGWRWDKGVCRFCGVGCGIKIATSEGRASASRMTRSAWRITSGSAVNTGSTPRRRQAKLTEEILAPPLSIMARLISIDPLGQVLTGPRVRPWCWVVHYLVLPKRVLTRGPSL